MGEALSIIGQLLRFGQSPEALRGRLAFATSRVAVLQGQIKALNPGRKMKRKKRALNYWTARVKTLTERIG